MPVKIPIHSPWKSQRLVIGALLHREAVSRFGQYKMGAMWMLLEPLTGVIVLGLLLGPFVGRTAPDMPYAFFLLNGLVLLQCFAGPMTAGMNAVRSNQGLLVFPKVQPLDLLLARFVFEISTSLLSFTVFCIVSMWIGVKISLGYLHILVACFVITWLFGSGLGMIMSVAAAEFPSVDKVVAFIRRPLLWISCVLYPLAGMPSSVQKVLLYNPLVHTIEISRQALFPLYNISGANLLYPTSVAIVFFSFGICLFYKNRHHLAEK